MHTPNTFQNKRTHVPWPEHDTTFSIQTYTPTHWRSWHNSTTKSDDYTTVRENSTLFLKVGWSNTIEPWLSRGIIQHNVEGVEKSKEWTPLWDKSSNPFIPSLLSIKILKDVVARAIPEYNGVVDPISQINMHEVSLLGRTDDDDYIALLGRAFYGFFWLR